MRFLRSLFAATKVLLALTLVLGVAYPLVITGIARVLPHRADGSVITVDGRTMGSSLLGQAVADPAYFWPRPSTSDYSGDTSGGSNWAESSRDQQAAVEQRRERLLAANPDAIGPIPPDALTASSSGLDPDISPEYAAWQAPRVAQASGLPLSEVKALIQAHTQRPALGFIGNPRVNVTELNADLAQQLNG